MLICMFAFQQINAQQRTISGVVTSIDTDDPLIGAAVYVKGNEAHGVVTDLDGKYSLNVNPGDKFLVFSYVGMKTAQ